MAPMSDDWVCRHFSLSNPRDDRSTDLPHLLRRLADEIDQQQIKPMDILDLTISSEMTEDGPWWATTIYWSPDDPAPTEAT
jgi:hypothetical protein